MPAGTAQTSQFLLSAGTVMIGAASRLMELTPEEHSIGLVKEVNFTTEPQFTELTQGIDAQVVYSVNTRNQARVSAQVFEMTARNLAYAAGVDASGVGWDPDTAQSRKYTLGAAIAGGGATVTLTAGDGADFAPTDYVVIHERYTDRLHVGKVASIAADTLTLTAETAIPADQAYPISTTDVFRVRQIPIGASDDNPTYGVKIVGIMPEKKEPVVLLFPKARITQGLAVGFNTEQFTSMPFQFTPQALLPTDPFYHDFGRGRQTGKILKAS